MEYKQVYRELMRFLWYLSLVWNSEGLRVVTAPRVLTREIYLPINIIQSYIRTGISKGTFIVLYDTVGRPMFVTYNTFRINYGFMCIQFNQISWTKKRKFLDTSDSAVSGRQASSWISYLTSTISSDVSVLPSKLRKHGIGLSSHNGNQQKVDWIFACT